MTSTFATQKPQWHVAWASPETEYHTHGIQACGELFQPFINEIELHADTGVTAESLVRYACIRHDFDPNDPAREPESHFIYAFIRENLIPHKIEVLRECLKVASIMEANAMHLMGRAVVHDLSKLSYKEILTYSQVHYAGGVKEYLAWSGRGIPIDHELSGERYSPSKKLNATIDHHYRVNDHHPEHWVVNGVAREMDKYACYEMVADWAAASKTYGTPLQDWIDGNFEKKPLHPSSREMARTVLEIVYNIKFKD
jgi:hypothetical protein